MHELVAYTGTVVMGFFAIMNPLANAPVFLGLTADDDAATRKAVARNSLFLAFAIVAVFTLAGNLIFEMFGITLFAFRVTGGILVFGIGYNMLHGEASKVHQPGETAAAASREAQLSVAISPLAVPILAGPGTIATAMNFVAEATLVHIFITISAFAFICVISYALFVSGEKLIRYIGDNAVNALTKMMGLILAVIGVQMFIEGAHGAIKSFQ
jgi:multiple antibiotic resistance protein